MSPWTRSVEYARRFLPVVVGALFILSVMFLVDRVQFLAGFDDELAGSGSFQVTQCDALGGERGQWLCNGALTVDGRLTEVSSRLLATSGATTSSRPYVGQQLDVFFRPEESGTVYPRSARLGELTRLYIQLVPVLLLLFGSLLWLVGWAAKRFSSPSQSTDEIIVVEKGRLLQPSWTVGDLGFGPVKLGSAGSIQRRGGIWMVAGLAVAVGVALLGRLVLGSLGLP